MRVVAKLALLVALAADFEATEEKRVLTSLRDALLPRLCSGGHSSKDEE
jgi:hypothetical protein